MEFDYFVTHNGFLNITTLQDLVIVDVSAPMPTQDIDYHQRYLERHIPGAHFFLIWMKPPIKQHHYHICCHLTHCFLKP